MANFTKESTLHDILKEEGNAEKLAKHGVPCPTCPMATMEMDKLNIGMIAGGYGLDIDAILSELNG